MVILQNVKSCQVLLCITLHKKRDVYKRQDEYGVTSPTDITNALKDLLGETLQDMLNSEFDEYMGYDKYDQKTDKKMCIRDRS